MKKIILALCALLFSVVAFSQNDNPDSIVGTYEAGVGVDAYKIRIVKLDDGTYQGAVCWLADPLDANGKVKVDTKNPNKALRGTPMDKVVIFSGLKYDAAKQQWSDAKIYDPDRGISVKMTARFENATKLVVRGTVQGIGERVAWNKVN